MTEQETKAAAEPPLDCRVGLTQPGKITVWRDEQAELLDDMADLCEYWKRNRSRGRTPNAIRRALVMLSADIAKTTLEAQGRGASSWSALFGA